MPPLVHDVHGDPDDPALVLLHSGGMSAAEWDPHVEPLVDAGFHLVVPDLPGHGRTLLDQGEELEVDAMADALLGLLDERGIERAHVAGSSLGGGVALQATLRAPERVDRLVLYRSGYRRTEATRAASRRIADPDRWRRLRMDTYLSRLHEPQGGPDAWVDVVERVGRMLTSDAGHHGTSLAELEALHHPVLLAVGDRDPVVPLEEVLDMHRAFPRSQLWVMPGATHVTATNTWRRGVFDEELVRFLQRDPDPTP